MPLNARYQLAALEAFLFYHFGVADALRVDDQQGCLFVSPKIASKCANRIFFKATSKRL
jgi:hypothetical protein